MPRLDGSVSAAGKSLLEKLWDELDTVMDCLQSGEYGPPRNYNDMPEWHEDVDWGQFQVDWQNWGELRGQAQGVAFAIAIIENPYHPSVPNVKARAVDRWEERQT